MEGVMRRIILITGPKHSGKSHCARVLAKLMDMAAVDLDGLIEAQSGKTPRELYTTGIDSFRKSEVQALASVLKSSKQKNLIIAAGGGLIDNGEAMALLSEAGPSRLEIITVYLDVSADTAWQRILDDGALPPFLKAGKPNDNPGDYHPWKIHQALHERRAEAYKAMANIIVIAENKKPEEIAGEIARRLVIF